jgi:hypothetical protein
MAAELVDRVNILVAVCRFPAMGAADSHSMGYGGYVRMQRFVRRTTYVLLRRFWGDVRREFMQHLFAALPRNLGSYPRDALHEGNADVVACLRVPRNLVLILFYSF